MTETQSQPRIFAIPDIHGRSDLLARMITKLTTENGLDLEVDKLVFLGDMIDRGPDSKGVVDIVRQLQQTAPNNVIVLAGNHDWLCINAYVRARMDDIQLWHWNGGGATCDSYGGAVPDETVRWMAALPVQHEEAGFFFSHAPVPKELFRKPQNRGQPYTVNELTWTYFGENDESRPVGHPNLIGVCGHIHRLSKGIMEPRLYPHYIFADAGCGCSRKAPLVAIECHTIEVIYVHPPEMFQETRS